MNKLLLSFLIGITLSTHSKTQSLSLPSSGQIATTITTGIAACYGWWYIKNYREYQQVISDAERYIEFCNADTEKDALSDTSLVAWHVSEWPTSYHISDNESEVVRKLGVDIPELSLCRCYGLNSYLKLIHALEVERQNIATLLKRLVPFRLETLESEKQKDWIGSIRYMFSNLIQQKLPKQYCIKAAELSQQLLIFSERFEEIKKVITKWEQNYSLQGKSCLKPMICELPREEGCQLSYCFFKQ